MTKAIKKDVAGEQTSLTPIVAQTIENFNVENLMAKAIEHGLSPETMEKFLTMRQQLKAEWAKEQYNKAMAGFQSQCPTIVKTKEVKTKSGVVAYKYAPIESIVEQVRAVLDKYGFSYSTSMEVLPEGVKVCVKTIHVAGHSEESCMQVPLGNKTEIMSHSQVTAAASTFAKRYAFCNAFGILTGDEDNDGAMIQPTQETATTAPNYAIKMASEPQLKLLKDLLEQKRIKAIDLPVRFPWYKTGMLQNKEVTGLQAKEMIDWLKTYVPSITKYSHIDKSGNIVDGALPVIEQELPQDIQDLAADIPFDDELIEDSNPLKDMGPVGKTAWEMAGEKLKNIS